jgi:hypothetical protein
MQVHRVVLTLEQTQLDRDVTAALVTDGAETRGRYLYDLQNV